MTDPFDSVDRLMDEAKALPNGPTKTTLLEEAVQRADSVNDVELAFRARQALIQAATFAGRPDIGVVAFAWCLAQFDLNPERFKAFDLMWKYKWIVGAARHFPSIRRSRIEEMLADMERRFRAMGSTLNAVAHVRRAFFVHIGDRAQARAAHAQWRRRRPDFLSDCKACVADHLCSYYQFLDQWGRAVQAALPVLNGRLHCTHQPHGILANVLMPLLRLGRIEEARAYQRQGIRLVNRDDQFVCEHGQHLQFLSLIGEMAQAKRLLESHLPGALKSVALENQFQFLLAARLWTDRLVGRGTRTVKVRLPRELTPLDAAGNHDIRAVGEWFTARAQEIAQQFDARNGTDAFQAKIHELPELLRLAVD